MEVRRSSRNVQHAETRGETSAPRHGVWISRLDIVDSIGCAALESFGAGMGRLEGPFGGVSVVDWLMVMKRLLLVKQRVYRNDETLELEWVSLCAEAPVLGLGMVMLTLLA